MLPSEYNSVDVTEARRFGFERCAVGFRISERNIVSPAPEMNGVDATAEEKRILHY